MQLIDFIVMRVAARDATSATLVPLHSDGAETPSRVTVTYAAKPPAEIQLGREVGVQIRTAG